MSGHNVKIIYEKLKHPDLLKFAKNCGVQEIKDPEMKEFDFVIDAVFGFSLKFPLKEPYATLVDKFRHHPNIISIDVPSDRTNFKVKHLVAFIAPKTVENCENVYVTRSFVPKENFNDCDFMNYRKLK